MESVAFKGFKVQPTVIVLGMAGSGKTTFVNCLANLRSPVPKPYLVNLDPAVYSLPYVPNVDIRDSVKFKETMKKYNLGPNGAILTCLNLFVTKFDTVLQKIESQSPEEYGFNVVDTPGQMEVFMWSASGSIIAEALACTMPTVIVFVVDSVKCVNPSSFVSNLLCVLSCMYKAKLPVVLAFTKIDVARHERAIDWLNDFELFQQVLQEHSSYSANLVSSLNLALEEFYKDLRVVGVSSVTSEGMDKVLSLINDSVDDFLKNYSPLFAKKKNVLSIGPNSSQRKARQSDNGSCCPKPGSGPDPSPIPRESGAPGTKEALVNKGSPDVLDSELVVPPEGDMGQ